MINAAGRGGKLIFGQGNGKLDQCVTTFSLSAGHHCPYAHACRSSADPKTGHITDGPHAEFRCHEASVEAMRPSVRRARWHNKELLDACKTTNEMVDLILASLNPWAGYVRVMVSGDFYSMRVLDAWLAVARERPKTTMYWYTKATVLWARRLKLMGDGYGPGDTPNVVPTASWGGTHDSLIAKHRLRSAKVILAFSPEDARRQADEAGLEIDHDDSHAARHGEDFLLVAHGPQPAGSDAAKAVASMRRNGEYGYGERADAIRAARLALPLV